MPYDVTENFPCVVLASVPLGSHTQEELSSVPADMQAFVRRGYEPTAGAPINRVKDLADGSQRSVELQLSPPGTQDGGNGGGGEGSPHFVHGRIGAYLSAFWHFVEYFSEELRLVYKKVKANPASVTDLQRAQLSAADHVFPAELKFGFCAHFETIVDAYIWLSSPAGHNLRDRFRYVQIVAYGRVLDLSDTQEAA